MSSSMNVLLIVSETLVTDLDVLLSFKSENKSNNYEIGTTSFSSDVNSNPVDITRHNDTEQKNRRGRKTTEISLSVPFTPDNSAAEELIYRNAQRGTNTLFLHYLPFGNDAVPSLKFGEVYEIDFSSKSNSIDTESNNLDYSYSVVKTYYLD